MCTGQDDYDRVTCCEKEYLFMHGWMTFVELCLSSRLCLLAFCEICFLAGDQGCFITVLGVILNAVIGCV